MHPCDDVNQECTMRVDSQSLEWTGSRGGGTWQLAETGEACNCYWMRDIAD